MWRSLPQKYKVILLLVIGSLALILFTNLRNRQLEEASFDFIDDISFDQQGNLYIVGDNCIRKLDANRNVSLWGEWSKCDSYSYDHSSVPHKLMIDRQNNFYALAYRPDGTSYIQKRDSSGKLLLSWGSEGNGDGQFKGRNYSSLGGITVDSEGLLYVVDRGNYRVQKFDGNGNFLGKWGSRGNNDGQFIDPTAIDVDGEGNVYVLDNGSSAIEKFCPDGRFLTKWASAGTGGRPLKYMQDLALDSEGNVYIAETNGKDRILKFDRDGNFLTEWESYPSPRDYVYLKGAAVDKQGKVYAIHSEGPRVTNDIQITDGNGKVLETIPGSTLTTRLLWGLFGLVSWALLVVLVFILITTAIADRLRKAKYQKLREPYR
jgi:hypothetical protein